MRIFSVVLFCLFAILSGCVNKDQAESLKQKEMELNKREEELVLREKNVQLQEEELEKKKLADSTVTIALQDTGTYNPSLVGVWEVKMNCIETNCSGSAIGDTKLEQWHISYIDKKVVTKAMVNDKVVREYEGLFQNTFLQQQVMQSDTTKKQPVKIFVNLQLKSDKHMEGRRIITQEDDCRIVYAMDMEKK